jgi:hypothetical protein
LALALALTSDLPLVLVRQELILADN